LNLFSLPYLQSLQTFVSFSRITYQKQLYGYFVT